MDILEKLAEQHIQRAVDAGQLDNLEGAGRPLRLDDDRHVPQALRAGYRLLKNAGFLPPELELRREISSVNELIRQAEPASQQQTQAQRRLQWLELRLGERRGPRPLHMDTDYAAQLRTRLSGTRGGY